MQVWPFQAPVVECFVLALLSLLCPLEVDVMSCAVEDWLSDIFSLLFSLQPPSCSCSCSSAISLGPTLNNMIEHFSHLQECEPRGEQRWRAGGFVWRWSICREYRIKTDDKSGATDHVEICFSTFLLSFSLNFASCSLYLHAFLTLVQTTCDI